jgi:DHA2 family multidrug resistance protein
LGFFLYGIVFILPVFMSQVFHYDATEIGLFFIPGSLLTAATMPFVGRAMQAGVNSKYLIAVGLLALEVTLVLNMHFSPLSSKGELLNMLFVRGFGMAFLFVPINSSILSQFKGIAMGQVSGLLNLFRQIGGSIGIAFMATMMTTRSAQNYLDLSTHVSLLNPPTQQAYYGALSAMAHKMSNTVGMATAHEAALKSIFFRIQAQAFMMTFIQVMAIIMIIFALAFIPLWRLRFRTRVGVVSGGH